MTKMMVSMETQPATTTTSVPLITTRRLRVNVLELGLFLREDSDAEVSVLLRLEGGREDQILPRGQTEAAADLSQVDEGFRASGGGVTQEEVLVEVNVPLSRVLKETHG